MKGMKQFKWQLLMLVMIVCVGAFGTAQVLATNSALSKKQQGVCDECYWKCPHYGGTYEGPGIGCVCCRTP